MSAHAILIVLVLFSRGVCGQDRSLERRASDFDSKGVGLTETLLKFSHQEHLPIAIEYIDRASMDKPVEISLRNKTVKQALDSILLHGSGYSWSVRNGIIEITNRHTSKRAEGQLNRVIPVFKIAEGETVQVASMMLWWELQMALDPKLRGGFGGHSMGKSSTMKPATLHKRTVREILSYIVLNGGADGWIVAGPPECLGFTPYCGLWFLLEQDHDGLSDELVLKRVRENL